MKIHICMNLDNRNGSEEVTWVKYLPISAFFKAGESLTPSPVTATIAPWRWHPSTMISFCCGDVRAKTISSWYFRILSNSLGDNSFKRPPWITAARASIGFTSESGIPLRTATSSAVSQSEKKNFRLLNLWLDWNRERMKHKNLWLTLWDDSNRLCNCLGSDGVIPSNHDNFDPGRSTFSNCIWDSCRKEFQSWLLVFRNMRLILTYQHGEDQSSTLNQRTEVRP